MGMMSKLFLLTVVSLPYWSDANTTSIPEHYREPCGAFNICDKRLHYCDTTDFTCRSDCGTVCAHRDKEACKLLCQYIEGYERGKRDQQSALSQTTTLPQSPSDQKLPESSVNKYSVTTVIITSTVVALVACGVTLLVLYLLCRYRPMTFKTLYLPLPNINGHSPPGAGQPFAETTDVQQRIGQSMSREQHNSDISHASYDAPNGNVSCSERVINQETTLHTSDNSRFGNSASGGRVNPLSEDSASRDAGSNLLPPPYSPRHDSAQQNNDRETSETLAKSVVPISKIAKVRPENAQPTTHELQGLARNSSDITNFGPD